MINDFLIYVEVYGIDNSSLDNDDYIVKFLNDMIKKDIKELTDNQRNFLKKSCGEIVKSIIKRIKDDADATAAFKQSLIFYRDNIKTL